MDPHAGLADATSLYAELVVGLGEFLDGASLVLPDGEHFPDRVEPTPAGIQVLFERVLTYTPVRADTKLALSFWAPDDEEAGGSCSSGACGGGSKASSAPPWRLPSSPLEPDADEVWPIVVAVRETGNPIRLMSQLSRLAGDLLLAQADLAEAESPFQRAVRAEVAAVACGLGPLLLAASHHTTKGCGGLHTAEATALPMHVLAGLVVVFAEHREEMAALRRAASSLQPTPRETLDQARAFFARRPSFIAHLRATPEAVAFHCDFGAEEGFFSRVFGKKPLAPPAFGT